MVVELCAPRASGDLSAPGQAEHLLLFRVREDVGAGCYPNERRSAVDVAEALIGSARQGRARGVAITSKTLLRRAQLRQDFGAVPRAYPVDKSVEVHRSIIVDSLRRAAEKAALSGVPLIVLGPPGQGKSWVCQQLSDSLTAADWLVAEHFLYLGDDCGQRDERVLVESVYGSLLGRLSDAEPSLVTEQRPRFAADDEALVNAVRRAIDRQPDRHVALVVDGLDHVTRVLGKGAQSDPSRSLAESLAALDFPAGCVLIVLSQPGPHLQPLEIAGATTEQIPGLDLKEIGLLAERRGLVPRPDQDSLESSDLPLATIEDSELVRPFIEALSERSTGNALYATYICREVKGHPESWSDPVSFIQRLPQFDGLLEGYYGYLVAELGEAASVADMLGLLDFSVNSEELRQIQPELAHRIDGALSVLAPVLSKKAGQGGLRVYHESFARFLRKSFERDPSAMVANLEKIAAWLKSKGFPEDDRAFRFLLPTLRATGRDREAVDIVGPDFVAMSVAHCYAPSAIRANLVAVIASASTIGDWPAVVRFVELSRAVGSYEYERMESALVDFVDVAIVVLGGERLSHRLLFEGRTVVPARIGLQLCAALDEHGVVAPWHEYMTSYQRAKDDTVYPDSSNSRVSVAWFRGRLRLLASTGPLLGNR